jgi:hypothetical protein
MKAKLILLFIAICIGSGLHAQTGFPFDNEIRDFKHQDSLKFPPKNGILSSALLMSQSSGGVWGAVSFGR